MGLAQDFKDIFSGFQFYLVENSKGVGKFRSNCVVIPEFNEEIYFELIVSLKDKYTLPNEIIIQDIYRCSERIHNISQFQNMPVKTDTLFDYAENEKTI
jgi:hypothetical protein